jgi:hypothetical protein
MGKVDVYSFALILYEIVVGAPVFSPTLDIPRLIGQVVLGKHAEIPEFVCPFVREMIGRCWSGDAQERPSFDLLLTDLESHSFKCFDDVDCEIVASFVQWVSLNSN